MRPRLTTGSPFREADLCPFISPQSGETYGEKMSLSSQDGNYWGANDDEARLELQGPSASELGRADHQPQWLVAAVNEDLQVTLDRAGIGESLEVVHALDRHSVDGQDHIARA